MIIGVGIDIVENHRIKLEDNFLSRFLHKQELKLLHSFSLPKRQIEFAAGRWAVKEAIIKAETKLIQPNQINIIYENEKPVIEGSEWAHLRISISHELNYSVGMAINEQ